MMWLTLSGLVFSLNFSIIRMLSHDLHVFEIVFFRNLFGAIVLIPWLIKAPRASLIPSRPVLMGARTILQVGALIVWYYALILTPFAEATALIMLEPIFAAIFAVLILGEKSSLQRWVAAGVGFGGTLIIVRPGFEVVTPGALLALAAAMFWAVYLIIGKVMTRTDSVTIVIAYPTALSVPIALVLSLYVWTWPTLEHWGWFVISGALASLANYCITKAYQVGDASAVSPAAFTRLLFAALAGYVFFAEIPSVWTWIGGAAIVGATTYLARIEAKSAA